MSSISAGTSAGSALVSTGDSTGDLILQVNGTTPSISLKANGAIGLGSGSSYGTAGQALLSGGSGAAPTWGTASPVVLLSTATPSAAASVVFDSTLVTTTYKVYQVVFDSVVAATNGAYLGLYLSTNNGSTYITTYYVGASTTVQMNLSGQVSSSASSGGASGTAFVYGRTNTGYAAITTSGSSINTVGNQNATINSSSANMSGSTFNNIKIAFDSGNITSGTIRLFGIA